MWSQAKHYRRARGVATCKSFAHVSEWVSLDCFSDCDCFVLISAEAIVDWILKRSHPSTERLHRLSLRYIYIVYRSVAKASALHVLALRHIAFCFRIVSSCFVLWHRAHDLRCNNELLGPLREIRISGTTSSSFKRCGGSCKRIFQHVVEEFGAVDGYHQALLCLSCDGCESATDGAVWREAFYRYVVPVTLWWLRTFELSGNRG